MKKTQLSPESVWLVAYINKDYISSLVKELTKNNQYSSIEFYIPTIKILKKQFKGKDIFDEVPFLFNYGFFKVPYPYAISPELLLKLREDISCIHSWVKDPAKVVGTKATSKLIHEGSGVPIATATEEEISKLVKSATINDIYSSQDIDNLKPGELITLVGYPFEGMEAEVVSIHKKKRQAIS